MKVRVFLATTEGVVQIERITREDARQSAICLKRTTKVLPVSAGYDAFVRPPSGVIEREFGPYPAGAFRLDVSGPVSEGESWQLGVFAAHALAAAGRLAGPDDEAGAAVWLTGGLDNDLRIIGVGHVPDKLEVSRPEFERQAGALPVTVFVPTANAEQATSADVPAGVRVRGVDTASEVLAALDLAPPRRGAAQDTAPPRHPPRSRRVWHWAARLGVIVLMAGAAAAIWLSVPDRDPATTAGDTEVTAAAGVGEGAAPRETPVPDPPLESAATEGAGAEAPGEAAAEGIAIEVFERRPAPGETCAQVHFGSAEAEEVPVPREDGGALATSRHEDLCGLRFEVRNPGAARYVVARFELLSGRTVGTARMPAALSGNAAFSGAQTWNIDLPARTRGALEYRLVVIAAAHPVAEAMERLSAGTDASSTIATLAEEGVEVTILDHRVVP